MVKKLKFLRVERVLSLQNTTCRMVKNVNRYSSGMKMERNARSLANLKILKDIIQK
jgi:hypothetical protein